ncbi:medium-chain fatty acid-CoA ligase faa2 [Sorochytrium milnesiophthora]
MLNLFVKGPFSAPVTLDKDAPAGEGVPRRVILGPVSPKTPIAALSGLPPGIHSLHESFVRGVKIAGDRPFLGHRQVVDGQPGAYVWQTYEQVLLRVKNLGHGLAKRGLKPTAPLAIFSINRPEWVISEQAAYLYSWVTVPLYDTLGNEAIQYILEQTEATVVVASKEKLEQASTLLGMKSRLPGMSLIVLMDPVDEALHTQASAAGVTVVYFKDVEAEGAKDIAMATPAPAKEGDLATICYTSGTTGVPKGVMITHANLLTEVYSVLTLSMDNKFPQLSQDDVHISYLPLAHVFERVVQQFLIYVGGSIGFYQGDTLKLLDDIAVLRPTLFVSVPRLLNRIYDKVWAGVKAKGGVAAALFTNAYYQKRVALALGFVQQPLWDKLVFSNVRSRLGGRVRFIVAASAPLSPSVMEFLRICFSCEVAEGYGQTEISGACNITISGDTSTGTVGPPMPCNEIKLVDVPEMGYRSTDTPCPRGEVWVRGGNIFVGYYKQPDKTRETLTEDGWCRTGDIGQWDDQGRLQIIDRVKNIFKLSQGEYVAPEKVENVYCTSNLVAQAFVYGNSLQSCVVAIIVPDHETLVPWAASLGIGGGQTDFAALVRREDVRQKLQQELAAYGRAQGLKGFEMAKAVYLDDTPFQPDGPDALLTPTFKLKRHEAQRKYAGIIDKLYEEVTREV